MVTRVEMPKFGLSMEEGTVASWLVQVGDAVEKGDALAEINSEKLTNTAEAPAAGVVRALVLAEDETAPCGALICILADTADEDVSEMLGGAGTTPGEEPPGAPDVEGPVAPVSAPVCGEIKITPRAKKRAEEQGLEYAHITGTGIGGAITISDLKHHGRPRTAQETAPVPTPTPAAPAPVPAETVCPIPAAHEPVYAAAGEGDEVVRMTPMQSTLCKSMYASLSTSAQTTLATEANVQNLVKVYRSIKDKYTAAGVKLSYTAMLIKSVAMALENHPIIRAQLVDEKHYKICGSIDIGVAVDIPNGLIVPVIRQANLKDLRTICMELADLTARAKAGTLSEGDLSGAVTTVTNLGMFGVTYFTPVLNAPESTILGVGSIVKKPVEREGGLFMESVMNLSLTHDHRISNGAPCARYLQEVVEGLQNFRWC